MASFSSNISPSPFPPFFVFQHGAFSPTVLSVDVAYAILGILFLCCFALLKTKDERIFHHFIYMRVVLYDWFLHSAYSLSIIESRISFSIYIICFVLLLYVFFSMLYVKAELFFQSIKFFPIFAWMNFFFFLFFSFCSSNTTRFTWKLIKGKLCAYWCAISLGEKLLKPSWKMVDFKWTQLKSITQIFMLLKHST